MGLVTASALAPGAGLARGPGRKADRRKQNEGMKLEITKGINGSWTVRSHGWEIHTTDLEETMRGLVTDTPAPKKPKTWPVVLAGVVLGLAGSVLAFGATTVARYGYLAVLMAALAVMALAGRKWGRHE